MTVKPWRCPVCGKTRCDNVTLWKTLSCRNDCEHYDRDKYGQVICNINSLLHADRCFCGAEDYIKYMVQQQFEIDRLNMNISRGIEWYMNYQGIVNDNDWRVKQLKRNMGRS